MPAKRVDPEDGTAYTYEELAAFYNRKYKKKDIEAYWDACKPVGRGSKAKEEKPKATAKAKVKVKAKAKVKRDPPQAVKLHYFGLKARCFPSLLALEVGKVNYEANVVEFADWPALKESGKYPFGYLAGLELADGTMINETNAILFTVGKIARLNGASTKDFGTSTMLACKAAEVFGELSAVQPSSLNVKDWNGEKAKKLEEFKPKCETYLKQFEDLCSDDGKITSQTTVGELHLFSVLYHMKTSKFKTDFGSKIDAFYSRLEALEGVKNCVDNKTKMGELGDYLVPVP